MSVLFVPVPEWQHARRCKVCVCVSSGGEGDVYLHICAVRSQTQNFTYFLYFPLVFLCSCVRMCIACDAYAHTRARLECARARASLSDAVRALARLVLADACVDAFS